VTAVRPELVRADRPVRPARRGRAVGPVGVRVRPRALAWTAALLVVLVALVAVALLTGTLALGPSRTWAALTGGGSRLDRLVVVDRRLARALVAVLVGFALGAAGACTQSVTRNPIATPDILGVTTGASAFAVLLVTRPGLGGELTGSALLVPATVAGGLLTAALVAVLSWRAGFDGLRLVLVGLGVNALALAMISWLLTRASLEEAAVATRWLVGSVSGARPGDLRILLPAAAVGLVAALLLHRDLGALRLGGDIATALGTRAGAVQLGTVALAVGLASAATAVAGPVGFVAFVAPQAAMRLLGTAGPPVLAGGLAGGVLLLGADLLAQRLPGDLPVGVVTAVLGAPALLALLVSATRRSSV
jgi:iron complex transport system permease protein